MSNIHFRWPQALDGVYQTRPEHQLSFFTDAFRHRLFDQQSWTMGRDYLAAFPDAMGMVCLHEPKPEPILLSDDETSMPLSRQASEVEQSDEGARGPNKRGRGNKR